MALSRLAAVIGGFLLSPSGRRFAGRHAGALTLAALAWELYRRHGRGDAAGARTATPSAGRPHPRRRWSGRRV